MTAYNSSVHRPNLHRAQTGKNFVVWRSPARRSHGPSYRYLIWIGSEQEKTFGPTISGLIHRNIGPERMTLWDSKKQGP
jgi:hypothetical protein